MLLDAAMTNCLFARGIPAVTGRLNIRFRHPVKLGANAVIHAWVIEQYPPLYVLKAELAQEGKVCALADAKFFQENAVEEKG